MNEIATLSDFINRNQGIVTLGLVYFVWRLKTNDLAKIVEALQVIGERIANIEGARRKR